MELVGQVHLPFEWADPHTTSAPNHSLLLLLCMRACTSVLHFKQLHVDDCSRSCIHTHLLTLVLSSRHDPAWKALYSLYNPDNLQGRSAGLQYSLANRQAIQKKVAARAAATAAAAAAERAAEQLQKPSPKKKVCRCRSRAEHCCTAMSAHSQSQ